MKILNFFIITNCLLLFFTSCDNNNHSSGIEANIEQYFYELNLNNQFNGAVLYKEDGKISFCKAYGIANRSLNTLFTDATRMEIASVSKQFTAMAILILKTNDQLDLDKSVNEYLPLSLPYTSITIRHLLTHTSGLPNYEDYFYSQWPSDTFCYNSDILNYYHELNADLLFEPGTSFSYNNGGYILLAEVVKYASGLSLDVFLDKEIFKKYHMESTGFVDREKLLTSDNFAPGYFYNSQTNDYYIPDNLKGNEYYSFLSKRLGPGRITTTVLDLSVWDSLLSTNTLLPYETYKEMITPYQLESDTATTNYAFGWRVNHNPESGWQCYHSGNWAGNKSYIGRFFKNIPGSKQHSLEKGEENNIGSIIYNLELPDQTIIIFSNTNSPQTSTIYHTVDSLILSYRSRALSD